MNLGGKIDKIYWVLLATVGAVALQLFQHFLFMKLSENFSLEELIKSQTATRKGIDNTPSPEHQENLNCSVRPSYSLFESTSDA